MEKSTDKVFDEYKKSKEKTQNSWLLEESDFFRSRWLVEKEKLYVSYRQFVFFGSDGVVSTLRGRIRTTINKYGYDVKVKIPKSYPLLIPEVTLVGQKIHQSCPFAYGDNRLYLMRPSEWSPIFTLSFLLAKTTMWLKKFELWEANDHEFWP